MFMVRIHTIAEAVTVLNMQYTMCEMTDAWQICVNEGHECEGEKDGEGDHNTSWYIKDTATVLHDVIISVSELT